MARSRSSLKRSLLLSAVVTLSLFSTTVVAQARQSSTTANAPTQSTTSPNNQPSSTSQTSAKTGVITATGKGSTTTNAGPTGLPTISGSSASNQPGDPTDLPSLSRTVDNSIPTYPPPAVPPTNKAPFMQQSTLPEGTVFIAVGAILGAFGAAVLIWRGVVACLLHRSVERAAMAQHAANDKVAFSAPPAPFYKYTDRDSSPNLAAGRGQRRTNRGPTPSSTPSQTNLFFSPTAGAGGGSMSNASNRDSRFLPSGFYAAGTASPANGHGHSISLSNLRPDSRGHPRPVGHSPPESPAFDPRTTPVPRNISASSINLNRPPSGRAPSAFLDDLLDENPHMFPSGPTHHHHHRSYSHSSQGRY